MAARVNNADDSFFFTLQKERHLVPNLNNNFLKKMIKNKIYITYIETPH